MYAVITKPLKSADKITKFSSNIDFIAYADRQLLKSFFFSMRKVHVFVTIGQFFRLAYVLLLLFVSSTAPATSGLP